MGESEFEAEWRPDSERDAELLFAVGEDGFQLRIAFEAFGHVAHRQARRPVAGHVAGLILPLAGLVELLPALHEAVGAAARVGAQFGFELKRADGAVDLAASRLADKFRVLLVGGFGVVRAWGRTSSKTLRASCNSFTCAGLALPPCSCEAKIASTARAWRTSARVRA